MAAQRAASGGFRRRGRARRAGWTALMAGARLAATHLFGLATVFKLLHRHHLVGPQVDRLGKGLRVRRGETGEQEDEQDQPGEGRV